ncbi:MAG: mercuric reductase [Candidatus Poribacteria bacterium]|nr:mercuric reductase [Candidatus Poribacteria bacterium]
MNDRPLVLPTDAHNDELIANVHPADWVNPTPNGRYNLVVIGGGTAGLVTAMGAAGLGAKVALVERHLLGGDCLNVGCVPSKCLIASARVVGELKRAAPLGVTISGEVNADFGVVMERMRKGRAHISHHDSAKLFRDAGIDVYLGSATFSGGNTVQVDGATLHFKKAVIATGGRAAVLDIPGLRDAGYLTNDTVFELTELPSRLAVIGGGPIGCELAQAFQRLGSQVTVFHRGDHLLNREDVDAAEIVQRAMIQDGVRLVLNATLNRIEPETHGRQIFFEGSGEEQSVTVDAVLVATGREPNVDGLGLDKVGVDVDARRGIRVNDRLQTTNRRIYAVGDVCMAHRFTHAADAAARIVIQNALFFGKKKVSALTMPWCTYTDPEVAHVGMYESDARAQGVEVDTFTRHFGDVDRALADGDKDGFVRIHVKKGSDEIVGATVVARHAGEMIGELTLAMTQGVGLGKLGSVIHPYPTRAEAIKHLGDAYNRTRLTPTVKKWFARFLEWTR